MKMKRYSLLLILMFSVGACSLFSSGSAAAQTIGEWQVYPSYWIAQRNIVVGNSVYGLTTAQETMMSNNVDKETQTFNLMRYDNEDTSVKTYNSIDDLNGQHIAQMAYSQEAKRLILVYDNGNIDLLDLKDQVQNIASLQQSTLNNRQVNDVFVDGKMAYLATGFGYITIDMQEGVIRDTYQLDYNVLQIAVLDGIIYLGTTTGLYRSTDKNLHLVANWQKTNGAVSYLAMEVFDGTLFILQATGLYQLLENGNLKTVHQERGIRFLCQSGGQLMFGTKDAIHIFTSQNDHKRIDMANEWQWVSLSGNTYWVSQGMDGLHAYRLADDTFKETVGSIQPNSPVRDFSYRVQYVGDRLLVSGGINTDNPIRNPATAMYYEDGKWTNLDEKTMAAEYPDLHHWNTTHIVQDPNDPSHIFTSNYRTGLYEYRDGKFVKLYNSENSPLLQIRNYGLNYVSCVGLQYDGNGNLWMMCQNTDTIVRIIQPSGKWVSLYYEEIDGSPTTDDYLFTTSGVNFLVSRRMDARGFFAFHTNGTLNTVRDDRHLLRQTLTNQDGTTYSPDRFFCMAEDLDGRVWCGTEAGLFVINDPTKFFDSDFAYEQIKISRNDGSGLADYLLSGVAVTSIVVDGANRKWIGTNSNGLYLISWDGQELLQHFQAEDSPLLSNNIQGLAIHPTTGVVMIATDQGLCSYVSDATEAAEVLDADNIVAYPNPVRPDYTGPITVRGLTMDSEVKILSSTGQLVWNGTSNGGTFTWNGTNKSGRRVSSGVYHVVANNASGKKAVVCRIIVIK